MLKMRFFLLFIFLFLMVSAACMAADSGLVAQWNFDEGQGQIIKDITGNGHNGNPFNADWVKDGNGYSLSLNGLDSYVDFGDIGISGPVSIEAWVKPTRKAKGETTLIGEGMGSYVLTYYDTEVCCWYIGSGGNSNQGKLKLNEWNHIAASFDGKSISLLVNGRLTSSKNSIITSYERGGKFTIGTIGHPDLAKFKGYMDNIRVYNRALSEQEAIAHFKNEASNYGYNPAWFSRVRVQHYYYPDRGQVVVEADYKGLQPLDSKAKLEVTLANSEKPDKLLQSKIIDTLPNSGVVEVQFSCKSLAKCEYVVRTILTDDKGARPTEQFTFLYPEKPKKLLSPAIKVAAALPAIRKPDPFGFILTNGGGFRLNVGGTDYDFQSRISWPNGDFNILSAADTPYIGGEKSWKVSTQSVGKNRYVVNTGGDFYSIKREITVFTNHVNLKDTYTNITDQDLGLLIYNETPVKSEQVTQSLLSGHERWGRQADLSYPDYSPTLFFTDQNNGIGIIPMDDVYIVQAVPYVLEDAAGVCTEKFALAPKASYSLEWTVYPTPSKDYYDFINSFRIAEKRNGSVKGAPGFITRSPSDRRQIPDKDYIEKRNLKIGLIHCLAEAADDPELSIEGIEFRDFPKEMQLLKEQAAAIHKKTPGFKVIFHIAHGLYCTNNPDIFPDSKVIDESGKQAIWSDASGAYISLARQKDNWIWWIFYPTPGNTFHKALLESVDIFMDKLGFDGGFMDGFMTAYQGKYTYDGRWDGHSAEIDLQSKTIKRKMGSVILLSQPSMIALAQKIRDKGGVVVANNSVMTRSIANQKYIIFDNECASGPELHLAPVLTALAAPPFKTEKDIYLDMLDKLSWGELFLYYGEGMDLTYPSLAAREFPMTFEEIRSGTVKGKERIVTMNSGVYGWPGDKSLHAVYTYDNRGAPTSRNDFITTTDNDGVRTEIAFAKHESAVIERIPLTIKTSNPVNILVKRYDQNRIQLHLNGKGKVLLNVKSGEFKIKQRKLYTINGTKKITANSKGELWIPLELTDSISVDIR